MDCDQIGLARIEGHAKESLQLANGRPKEVRKHAHAASKVWLKNINFLKYSCLTVDFPVFSGMHHPPNFHAELVTYT